MKHHELTDGGKKLLVRASTKAGLLSAAVQGLMAASGARASEIEDEEKKERAFSVDAEDFGDLLAKILTEAAALSKANNEVYEDVTFSLVTDKKAEGAFVGREATAIDEPKSGVKAPDEVAKNDAGEWEVTLILKA